MQTQRIPLTSLILAAALLLAGCGDQAQRAHLRVPPTDSTPDSTTASRRGSSRPDPAETRLDEAVRRQQVMQAARQAESAARYRQGLQLYKASQYREALQQFEQALRLDPGNDKARLYRRKCQRLLGTGRSDLLQARLVEEAHLQDRAVEMELRAALARAERLYRNAVTLERNRTVADPLMRIAQAEGDLKRALRQLDRIQTLLPALDVTTAEPSAVQRQAAALRGAIGGARTRLVQTRETMEQAQALAKSRTHAHAVRADADRRYEALLQSARHFLDAGRYAKAETLLQETITLAPGRNEAQALLRRARRARHHFETLRNEQALQDAEANWQLDVARAAVTPSRPVEYPDDWDRIQARARQMRPAP